ncbi:penicillin-binding transpeptidase domain-containing protein [Streptomyces sp. NBC_01317]|uniref:penicillin-binding transpeptidase domain-containing protein n=1 Tax=Streptomyces sp. NBC_01317 TaxID=2903822 RepID=UPI002E0F4893|nr:penicillin-binding transpeptidase domain-containing protein [Streptomyces sp. NBC_01317]
MRSGAKVAIVGGVFAVVVGGVGYGAVNVYNGLGDSGTDGTTTTSQSEEVKTGPLSAEEIDTAAKGFLAAWASGKDPAAAAQLTNNAAEAQSVLTDYRDTAHVASAVITPGTPVGAKVPYTVKATVTFDGKSKPWSYSSELTVVRGLTTGKPLVDWAPSVIHPQLTATTSLVTGEASVPPIEAVDRNGTALTAEKYPSLASILDELRKKYGEDAGGTPGIELSLSSDDATTPNRTLLTLAKGRTGKLRTTLDATVQAAAETAVKKFSEASVAAVKPSTGEIIAVANNRSDGWNAAMLGKQAPGSTLKILTAAMLMEKGLVSPDGAADCSPDVLYQGRTFTNLEGFSIPGGTFAQSFARSCNTGFIHFIDDTHDDAALSKEAQEVFGIGLNWQTGVTSFDGSVPAAAGGEAAAQYIGQGTVQMNVLNLASITATAKNGTFRQPVIVSKTLDDRQIAYARRSLPSAVSQNLRYLMRLTATSSYGTATQAMSGLGGDKGAKTGSAEVDNQADSNSWFTGYQDDLSAAAVVQSGGHGADAAGPVVAAVLGAG